MALLADTVHNLGDALNSVPLLVACYLARRAATRRYTYGLGKAEDVAGIFILLSIAVSAGVALWQSVEKLIRPAPVTSQVTSDCLLDCLCRCWETIRDRFSAVTTLQLNLDNGPETHSRRTQFMARIVDFVRRYQMTVQLTYYPPYHSKYNPIERCWAALEHHWNGSLLDSVDAVLNFAKTMTGKAFTP